MSSEAMKAVFDNLTSGASRRAEQGYDTDSATHQEADSIEVNVRSARLSTQMHVMDWAEALCEYPEIKATMDWCHFNKKKSEPWMEQLAKLKSRLGPKKNTPEGRSILQNADTLTLSGGLLYYRLKLKYQIEEVKCFVVPRVHRSTAFDGHHHDGGHQGKKGTESLISDQFWWPGVYKDVDRACSQFRISQLTTTAYHPQGNGQMEQAHQTLGRMIGKLEDEYKGQWSRHLSKLTHTYNSTRSAMMGYSPHFLIFRMMAKVANRICLPYT